MWQEWYAQGRICWENSNHDQLTIVNRHDWEVLLNNVKKTSRSTLLEAKTVAERFMKEFP